MTTIHQPLEEASPDYEAARLAAEALLGHAPKEAVALFWALAASLYEAQFPLVADGGVLRCPQCGTEYGGDELTFLHRVLLVSDREYPVELNQSAHTLTLEASDQDPGSGMPLYVECEHCDATLKYPTGVEVVRP